MVVNAKGVSAPHPFCIAPVQPAAPRCSVGFQLAEPDGAAGHKEMLLFM